MNGIHHSLRVKVCESVEDAVAKGHVYRAPEYQPIRIEQVVVVKNGTEAGKPTVDLILVDEHGQKYAALLTGALIKSIPCGE